MCLPERPKVGTVRLGCLVGLLGRGRVSQKWTPTRAQGCSYGTDQGSALPQVLVMTFLGSLGARRAERACLPGAESPLASLKRREVGFPSPREGASLHPGPQGGEGSAHPLHPGWWPVGSHGPDPHQAPGSVPLTLLDCRPEGSACPPGSWTPSSMMPLSSTTWRARTRAASWSPSALARSLPPLAMASPCRRTPTGSGP